MSESTSAWILDNAMLSKFKQTTWCVTEKIHGANFSFFVTPTSVAVAKRKEFLKSEDTFYPGYKLVQEELAPKVTELFALLSQDFPRLETATIFGELFGGGYPHPDVPAHPGLSLVQTGVHYCPGLNFCAFDIFVCQTGKPPKFVDYSAAMALFERVGLYFAKPLHLGTYQSCLDYPVIFKSTVPDTFGLPKLESNDAEGVVIKPLSEIYVTTKKGVQRAIVKNKSPKFAEVHYHEAEKPQTYQQNDSVLENLRYEITAYVTENRLESTESKIGQILPGEGPKLNQLFQALLEEILEEFQNDSGEEIKKLMKSEMDILKAELEDLIKTLIKSFYKNKWKDMRAKGQIP